MRLKQQEIQSIITVFDHYIGTQVKAELYLFGSRSDDTKKGGDIDLLLVGDEALVTKLKENKNKIFREIQDKIGEQRVDLTFASYGQIADDEFLQSIMPTACLLRKYQHPIGN